MVVILSDDVVIFSHCKVNWVDLELRPGAEFSDAAVTAGNITSVSKQQPLLSYSPEKRRSQPH